MHRRSSHPLGRRTHTATALLTALVGALGLVASDRAHAAITGTVFRDYNQNGQRDNSATFVEPFAQGIQVTAYDAGGASVATATSSSTGAYTLTTPGAGRYRVEFTIPASKSFLRFGPAGSGLATSVQFLADGGTANVGVSNPADYCQSNPMLTTTCYRFGPENGPFASRHALVRWPYTATSPAPASLGSGAPNPLLQPLGTQGDLGSTFGGAFHRSSKTLFVAAYMRRHTGFGPDGPMAIYQVPDADAATPGSPTLFANLNSVPGATAATVVDPHPTGTYNFNQWFHDPASFSAVGKLGLGGIAVSDDDTTLWAMNLSDRTLLKMGIGSGGSPVAPTAASAFAVPNQCKNAYATRPFAVVEHDGIVYVGGVCSGQTGPAAGQRDATDMNAWVVTFDPTTSTWGSKVLNFPSGYSRNRVFIGDTVRGTYTPWKDSFSELAFNTVGGPQGNMQVPTTYEGMLTDLAFHGDDMVVAFRPRTTDQIGNYTGDTASGSAFYTGFPAGEIVRACKATAGGWLPESNASSVAGCATAFGPGAAPGNGGGPGGGEFYYDGMNDGGTGANAFHAETIAGGLHQIPGSFELAASMSDPNDICSGGAALLSQNNGSRVRNTLIIAGDLCENNPPETFGKSNGIGDIIALCDLAPIQIGNRVWLDKDADGIQDAGEAPLAGIQVKLFAPGADPASATALATATTDASGNYIFSNGTGTSTASSRFGVTGLTKLTNDFQIVIDTTQTAVTTPGLVLTKADGDATTNGDFRDSDATLTGNFAIVNVDVAGPGNNNHSYDVGFVGFSLGNRVWLDPNNNGGLDTGETPVAGVLVRLLNAAGTAVNDPVSGAALTATTDANGYYRFDGLTAGDYRVQVDKTNFATGGPLVNHLSSTVNGPAPNSNAESEDDGVDDAAPATNGITSPAITLGPGSVEPETADGETDRSTSDTALHLTPVTDARTNLTLDFGFFKPLSVGNRVWKDTNNDGLISGGETGITGVKVNLLDSVGAPATNGRGILVAQATTDPSGFFRFDDLIPGSYTICVDKASFAAAAPLVAMRSSTTTEPSPEGDTDSDDNGIDDSAPATNGICAASVTLSAGDEPLGDLGGGPGHGPNGDVQSNLTVDFGFFLPFSLGNRVWNDANNNGAFDTGELGITGVKLNLLDAAGDPVIGAAQAATDPSGFFRFDDLPPGDYKVQVDPVSFQTGGPLVLFRSSTTTEASPNADVDANDNGIDSATPDVGGITTGTIALGTGNEPSGDLGGGPGHGAVGDVHSNLSLDFGFWKPLSVGNRVWFDADGSGTMNGTESGIEGVKVDLLDAAGNPVAGVAQETTDPNGFFRFDGLAPGTYKVRVAAANFQASGVLETYISSAVTEASPDTNVDKNDNGVDSATPATGGITSGVVTLGPGNEPDTTVETGGGTNGPTGDLRDNLTVDFGFLVPFSIGNRVWADTDNSGTINAADGTNPGVAGAKVNLVDSAGNPVAGVAQQTTDADGFFRFDGLAPGDVKVCVDKSNFSGAGVLLGSTSSSTTEADPDGGSDSNDNGIDAAAPATNGVCSGVVTLGPGTPVSGGEPLADLGGGPSHGPVGDSQSELTVDFGFFFPFSLGNRVWNDKDNSGTLNAADGVSPGILGAKLNLLDSAGAPVLDGAGLPVTATTDSNGFFRFDNLLPGTYQVELAASNFTGAGALVGLMSSTTTVGDPNSDVDLDDNGIDSIDPSTTPIATGTIQIGPGSEPTGDLGSGPGHGVGGDARSNLTVDFGMVKAFSLGNRVWNDKDNSGTINAADGATPGIDGVKLTLLDASGTPVAGVPIATSDPNGFFRFDGLPPGDYKVRINTTNFAVGGVIEGMGSSTTTEANPNLDIDSNDNGIDSATPVTTGVTSGVVTLGPGNEPASESGGGVQGPSGDLGANLTLDFGFVTPFSLGNRVWNDADNSGDINGADGASPGIAGVKLNLLDAAGNPVAGVTQQTTDSDGFYRFDTLLPGTYKVCADKANFAPAGALANLRSSTVTVASSDTDINSDDNGIDDAAAATNGICAGVVTLGPSTEPTGDLGSGPGDGPHGDDHSNLTVDMGFFAPYSVGNRVWFDDNNNGLIDDGATPGVAGVKVNILDAAGNPVAGGAQQTTDADGFFRFDNLLPGTFTLELDKSNFATGGPLAGSVSATTTEASPDANVNNNDNGIDNVDPATNGIRTGVVTLGAPGVLAEPTGDLGAGPGHGPNGDDHSNLTVDFGQFRPFSLGNRVWRDLDNSGTINTADGASPGLTGVTVNLLDGAGAPVLDGAGAPITTTTGLNGFFRFDMLVPGDYTVEIDKASFGAGQPLEGAVSSTVTEADPNVDGDTNDNGIDNPTPATNGIRSAVVTLGPGGGEPTGDLGGGPGHGAGGDGRSNLTLDFGFVQPFSLGNRVWLDIDNSGTINGADGATPGAAGVKVNLVDSGGNPANDIFGNAVAQATTDSNGFFRFDGLAPTGFKVCVDRTNFGGAGALGGHASSTITEASPNADIDSTDNGIDSATPGTTGVCSGLVNLGPGNEPTGDLGDGPAHGAADIRSNLTVDFGFFKPFSVGNRIWRDLDGSGDVSAADGATPGIGGVFVNLLDATGNPASDVNGSTVLQATTDPNGFFRFDNLPPGDYRVEVDKASFDTAQPLEFHKSSTVTETNPNADINSTDNGLDNPDPATNGIRTGVISLGPALEPTGDLGGGPGNGPHGDNHSNLTIDLGFFTPFTLGNRVWRDLDNSGALDAADGATPGVAGVKVNLLTPAGGPVTDADGITVAQATTDTDGFFRFDDLVPGDYKVEVDKASFAAGEPLEVHKSSTTTEAGPNANVDANDNGVDASAPATTGVRSGVVTLGPGTEPTSDLGGGPGHGVAGDNFSNLTVDFGFFKPFTLGSRVVTDLDNSGTINALDGATPGTPGVVVKLTDAAGNAVTDADGAPVTTTSTDPDGFFRFDNLVPGDYRVELVKTNFLAGGAIEAFTSSDPTEPDPNTNTIGDDNGIDDPNPGTNGITTGVITLGPGNEPTGDLSGGPGHGPTGDNHSNLTIGFGVFKPFVLGNRIFADADNSGTLNATDGATPGIGGVKVTLLTGTGDPVTDADGVPVGQATTDSDGFFRFENLVPGDYIMDVDKANFAATKPLEHWASSTATEADPNLNVDGNDNGINNANPQTNGIRTGALKLGPGTEPTGDLDGGPGHGSTGDDHSNLTVDFGFFKPYSLGNRVFADPNNSGTIDGPDGATPGIAGVKINLLDGAGDPADDAFGNPIPQATTDTDGFFRFDRLAAGTFKVEIDTVNFAPGAALEGKTSSDPTSATPNDDTDSDDNGIDSATPATVAIQSGQVTIGPDTEPTADLGGGPGHGPFGDDHSNLTVDFGFYLPFSLGNRVALDINNNGTLEPTEVGPAGVKVNLFDGDGNPTVDINANTVVQTTTDPNGFFRFDNLPPGDYTVEVDAASFGAGQPLEHFVSSTTTETNANANGNNNDNGIDERDPATDGVATAAITLGPGGEPTGELGTGPGDGPHGDAHSNLTLDFGFVKPYSLGNRVFLDADNSGTMGLSELGVANVVVALLDGNGDPARDANGDLVPPATTTPNGFYRFDNLLPGDYRVRANAVNFQAGGLLENLVSSGPTELDPDANGDGNDNGVAVADPLADGITSGVVTLGPGDEPTGDLGTGPGHGTTGDDHSNLTVDLGFYGPYTVGDRVFADLNNNGLFDTGEVGIKDVVVNVRQPDGTLIVTTATGNDGFFRVDGLAPGDVKVQIDKSNFEPNAVLGHMGSSQTTEVDPNADIDGNDNGIDNPTPTSTGISSGVVTLGSADPQGDSEPAGDLGTGPGHGPNGDLHSNLTIDFGFYPKATIGDRVWFDVNYNGVQDPGEVGIAGVVVRLLQSGGLIAERVTDKDGAFEFIDIVPGNDYQLEVVPPPSYLVTTPGAGSDPTLDSTIDPTTKRTAMLTIAPGQKDPAFDIGLWKPSAIGQVIWNDLNGDGLRTSDEPGLPGVTVTLFKNGERVTDTQTGPDGTYRFENVVPGDGYAVEVTLPAGFIVTLQDQGPADNRDSDLDRTTHRSATISVAPGEQNLTVDGGLFQPGAIGDTVWIDTNGNGTQDEGELGVPDVQINVFRAGVLIGSTKTDANGKYRIDGLPSGQQVEVEFIPPTGFVLGVSTRQTVTVPPNGEVLGVDMPLLVSKATASVERATIAITEVGPPIARAKGTATYVISVKNVSPTNITATAVTVTDALAPGTTFVPDGSSPGLTLRSGRVYSRLGDLRRAQVKRIRITVRISHGAASRLVNRSTASASNASRVRAQAATRILPSGAAAPAVTG